MSLIESYNPVVDPLKYADPWELEPYETHDELGIRYQAVTGDLPGQACLLKRSENWRWLERRRNACPRHHKCAARQPPPHLGRECRMAQSREEQHHSSFHRMARQDLNGKNVFAAIGEKGTMMIPDRFSRQVPAYRSELRLSDRSLGWCDELVYLRNRSSRRDRFSAIRSNLW